MPLYEYECKQCHHRLEKIQHFSAPPERVCPTCGGELERVISAPAIRFKGSGWYINDYAKSGGKAPSSKDGTNKSENKSDASSSTTDGSKSDSGCKSDSGSKSDAPATVSSSSNTSASASTSTGSNTASSGSSSSGSSSSKSD